MAGAFKGALDKNKLGINEVTSSEKLLEHTFDPWGKTEISEEAVS